MHRLHYHSSVEGHIHGPSCEDYNKPATTLLQYETLFLLTYCLLRFEQLS